VSISKSVFHQLRPETKTYLTQVGRLDRMNDAAAGPPNLNSASSCDLDL